MKIYQYHSVIFGSEVQVAYNTNGLLIGFTVINGGQVDKIHTEAQLFNNFFRELDFLASAQQHKLKLVQVEREVTFEMFWDAYKEKNCGRTKAEQAWEKLSVADKIQAFDFIPAFNGILKMNATAKPYATTYLNQKRWIR